MNQEVSIKKKAQQSQKPKEDTTLKAHYLEQLKTFAPDIIELIGNGELIVPEDVPTVRSASDYSYAASHYAGPHYRLVGDAAGWYFPSTNSVH